MCESKSKYMNLCYSVVCSDRVYRLGDKFTVNRKHRDTSWWTCSSIEQIIGSIFTISSDQSCGASKLCENIHQSILSQVHILLDWHFSTMEVFRSVNLKKTYFFIDTNIFRAIWYNYLTFSQPFPSPNQWPPPLEMGQTLLRIPWPHWGAASWRPRWPWPSWWGSWGRPPAWWGAWRGPRGWPCAAGWGSAGRSPARGGASRSQTWHHQHMRNLCSVHKHGQEVNKYGDMEIGSCNISYLQYRPRQNRMFWGEMFGLRTSF